MRRSTNQLTNGVDEASSRRRRHGVPSDQPSTESAGTCARGTTRTGSNRPTWFSPPVEAVAGDVAAEQSPATWSHRHCMGLFGHMRIHESGIDRSPDTPTSYTMPRPAIAPSPCAPITTTTTTASSVDDTDTAIFSCPHCPRAFTSRIGLVSHL
ncbi:hypothetical protein SprV_0602152300 [Sparganum proliferum]